MAAYSIQRIRRIFLKTVEFVRYIGGQTREWYISSMKVKTSVTLSQELLKVVDRHARQHKKNRSDFIETAVWTFLAQLSRDEINARDLEIINRHAEDLNREAADVLSYQAPV
jgi:hypothetical protein